MKANTDKISEQYRKYIINLRLDKRTQLYVLWGTDKEEIDFDYLLVNNKNDILAFSRISDLKDYIQTNPILIDSENTKSWAKSHKNNKPYITYDLLKIKSKLYSGDISLNDIDRDEAFEWVDLYNLIADYAYQTSDKMLSKVIKERNIKIFYNYVYEFFFWDKTGREQKIQYNARQFDAYAFLKYYSQMVSLFERKIFIVNK